MIDMCLKEINKELRIWEKVYHNHEANGNPFEAAHIERENLRPLYNLLASAHSVMKVKTKIVKSKIWRG